MTAWNETNAHTTFQFTESLERRGFRADGNMFTGPVGEGADAVAVEISLPDGFPFVPPVVMPPAEFPHSWHRERSGAMCLYSTDGRGDLPWLDVGDFIATVTLWITESRTGWTSDFPDLDLERYFRASDEPLVVYSHLDYPYIALRRYPNVTRVTGHGSIPKMRRLGKDRAFGFITDIGAPNAPPTNWDELKALITVVDAATIEKAVAEHRIEYLILRYSRNGVDAALVLRVWKDQMGAMVLNSVRSASEANVTLTLRSGLQSERLADARVAVVGVGAIGSFVCDLLARSGVGTIAAYDPDTVRPGNLIRHLAADDSVGLKKPTAVRQMIESRRYNSSTSVVCHADRLIQPAAAMILFEEHDVVIDATASGSATNLLASAAAAGGHHLVSVCLQEEGSVVRVDIIPQLRGDALPETVLGPVPAPEDARLEAGCGDPVSLTPAFAVLEAASLAVRHAIGLLTDSPVSDAGTTRDYR